MNDPLEDPSPGALLRRVRVMGELWQEEAEQLDRFARWFAEHGIEDIDWLCLLVQAGERRHYWCSLLLDLFGVDIEERRQVQPALIDDPRGYIAAAQWAIFWHSTVLAMIDVYNAPLPDGLSREAQVCQVYFAAWRVRRSIPGFVMEHCPDPRWRESAAVALAGAVRAAAAIDALPEAWDELLPGSVVEAWTKVPSEERTPGRVKDQTVSALREFSRLDKQRPKRVKQPDGSYAPAPRISLSKLEELMTGPESVEDFILREEVEQARRALLAPRELEVWELDQQGYKDREIADLRGMSLGAVAKNLSRARTKIRRAGLA
jgi:hypothetical protein